MFYLRSLTSAIKIQLYNSQMSGNRRQLYKNWRNLLSDKDQQYPVRESIIWGIFIILTKSLQFLPTSGIRRLH